MSEGRSAITGNLVRWIWPANGPGPSSGGRACASVNVSEEGRTVAVWGEFSDSVKVGAVIRADGSWKTSERYGRQFYATNVTPELPRTRKGMVAWLSELPGIGVKTAEKLVDHKGTEWLWRTLSDPDPVAALAKIPGLTSARATSIAENVTKQGGERDLQVFLRSVGVTPAAQARILKEFGDDPGKALAALQSNPYLLTRVRGIGFETADRYARAMGWALDNPDRVTAGVEWFLAALADGGAESVVPKTVDRAGHCRCEMETFTTMACQLLTVAPSALMSAVSTLRNAGRLVITETKGGAWIASSRWDRHEHVAATNIKRLMTTGAGYPISDEIVSAFERGAGVTLSEEQRDGLRKVTSSGVAVLTGLPGTGKTTVIKALVHNFLARRLTVALCAPTGRASRRLAQAAGQEATTIHRLLGMDPVSRRFIHNESHRLTCDAVVVDEASMVDVALLAALVCALPDGCHLVIVGDPRQLPSVGPGQVLTDLITARVPSAMLTRIYRQAAGSGIIQAAHKINQGENPTLAEWDGARLRRDTAYMVEASGEEVVDVCKRILTRAREEMGITVMDQQVLCPMRSRDGGINALNDGLGPYLNPDGALAFGGMRVGDKVLQTKNNADLGISNGDTGIIVSGDNGHVVVDFGLEAPVTITKEEAGDLVPGNALTIHKSQGSEYRLVIIVMLTSHYVMLTRQLLYTAITRGKEVVFIVGAKKAVATAVRQTAASVRWTGLVERIRLQG